MKTNSLVAALSLVATLGFAGNAQAYQTFFGEDLNSSSSTPLSLIPNSSAAEASFLSFLSGVGTETFESQSTGAGVPLVLTFPGAGNATLSGGNGVVAAVTPGTTNGFGRYSVPSATSSKFWSVEAGGSGNFTITFSAPIAALGFYGVDIGDFGGQLTLGVNSNVLTVANTIGTGGSTDGSVLFYGLIAGVGEEFSSVVFNTTTGSGDVFAFDNFTVGSREQVCEPGTPGCGNSSVPEPATLALFGLALAGLGVARKRKL